LLHFRASRGKGQKGSVACGWREGLGKAGFVLAEGGGGAAAKGGGKKLIVVLIKSVVVFKKERI